MVFNKCFFKKMNTYKKSKLFFVVMFYLAYNSLFILEGARNN